MKRSIILIGLSVWMTLGALAQGLRYSVCIVEPEYTESKKEVMSDYSLYIARAGMPSASRALGAYKSENLFGSGVLVEYEGKKYVLTNLHVVGYAQTAQIRFQLHDKSVRYTSCPIVATSSMSDLAAISMPDHCEMIPLLIYAGDINEEQEIAAAGFPGLGNKPSWQLTKGYISNAQLEAEGFEQTTRVIQHTASIDPGSSGGPLLLKNTEGKYTIIGINTWKAAYRDGVGLAIGKEDIQAFMNTLKNPSNEEYKVLDEVAKTSGEDWLYAFRKLPENVQIQVREMDWRLPLDPVVRVNAIRDSLAQNSKKGTRQFDRSASHIVKDMDHLKILRFSYENFLSNDHQLSVQFGFDWLGFIPMGVMINPVLVHCQRVDELYSKKYNDYPLRVGVVFGAFIGGQIPISVGNHILVPRITQSAGGGPLISKNPNGGFLITTDTRIGVDWRIPFNSCCLIIGVNYDMNWLWTKDNLNKKAYKKAADAEHLNQYLQHGIGLSVGLGF